MADASYDVVLIGGGNKGLIAAMYLAKYGGLSVGIFEDKHELGGGWCTEESPAPGFLANHCSSHHTLEYHTLVYEDFPEWEEYGAKPIEHLYGSGVIFADDDTCLMIYTPRSDPTREKTAKLFSRFSERDAEKLLWLFDKVEKYWRPAMRQWVWNPAKPVSQMDVMDELIANPESGIDPRWMDMTYLEILADIFETPAVQMTFARRIESFGVPPDVDNCGLLFVTSMAMASTPITFAGGVHALAHASQRVIMENGGKVFTQSTVDRIIIENSRAKGIRLADGTEVEAKVAVLSGVDPYQLCVELIGEDYLSHEIIDKIKGLERDFSGVITWYTWACRERPRYKAESFLPELSQCYSIALAATKSLDNLHEEVRRRRKGLWPDPAKMNILVVNQHILPDAGYTPAGMAAPLTEAFVIPAHLHDEQWWKEREKLHAEEVINNWQKFAPNMTWDNVIGYVPITPYYVAQHARTWGPAGNWCSIDNIPSQFGKLRPIPELAGHRMPIKNLYATGTAWHPAANAWSWQGYTVYKVMAEDFGLRKPWEEKGRPY